MCNVLNLCSVGGAVGTQYAPEAVELQFNFPQLAASGYLDLEYPLISVIQTSVRAFFSFAVPEQTQVKAALN